MNQKKTIFSLKNFITLVYLIFGFGNLVAQELSIELSNTKIALNEAFTIAVESRDMEITKIGIFPEIDGFRKIKSGLTNATSSSTIQGKTTITYIKIQTYHPTKEGNFVLKPFSIEVNGKKIESEGLARISVGSYDKNKGELVEFDPQELFSKNDEEKLVDVKEDAFFGLIANKDEVYVGEGLNVTLAMYIAVNNQAPMKFHELGNQVEEIAKIIKPANCWEENFDIREIPESPVININGKDYYQYKFYESTFFPINTEEINFPKLGLKMLVKKKIDAKNPNEFNENLDSELKDFFSNPRSIQVKPLPPHPLRDKIAVGNFYLIENYPSQTTKTGESFGFGFQISGQGNISAIQQPKISNYVNFEIYPPNIKQFILRGQGKISGTMTYTYQIISKEAGNYPLKDYFEWIYFNLNTQNYDTLRPQSVLKVLGESTRNAEISAYQNNEFYKKIPNEDKMFFSKLSNEKTKLIAEIIIFIFLVAMVFLLFRK